MNIKPNDCAYPFTYEERYGSEDQFSRQAVEYGLTKREYFAAMAMQGMLANPQIVMGAHPDRIMEIISIASVEHADDLIRELNKDA